MKAIVLSAGRSKRMAPISDKTFLDFLGKPLIIHQLEMLIKAGFNDILVVANFQNIEKIKDVVANLDAKINVVEQKDLETGMKGAVLACEEFLGNDPVLIFSSNDVLDNSAFSTILEAYKAGGAESYILGKKVESYFPGGYLNVDDNSNIIGIVEKPGEGNEPSDLVNLVVHLHTKPLELLKYLKNSDSENDDLYEVALDNMIKDGNVMKAVSYDGFWQPIKFPWHVHKVFLYFFSKEEKRVSKEAKIADGAFINGEVIIEDGVKIFDGAIVSGPVYLGKNAVVANNALVRESHLGEGCVAGFSTEIARSFLGKDVWTHSNYIGDSVIGNNVSFGAGTVTGNLRLDEGEIKVNVSGELVNSNSVKLGLIAGDNIRVGVNTSFMPGIKVGSDSFIGAGIVVAKDIPKKSFVRGKIDLKISENKFDISDNDRSSFKNNLKK